MKPIEINAENLAELVLNSAKPVVLYFWHEQCGPCRSVSPKIDLLAAEYGDRVTVGKNNIRQSPGPAEHFKLFGVPQVFLLSNGEVKHRIHGGAEPVEHIKLMVDELLAASAPATAAALSAKEELDQAVASATAEFQRVCREAMAEYDAPLKDQKAKVEAAWQPIAEERDRLLADERGKRDRGEITKDEWFRVMAATTRSLMSDERFKDAAAAYNAASAELAEASEPYWSVYESKLAAGEQVFNDAVSSARKRYQDSLSGN
jgi:thioredoxin 1